jgi:O-antigen ligase
LNRNPILGRMPRRGAMPPLQQPAAVAAPRARRENKAHVMTAAILYWLVMARVIIPGFFDYDPDVDVLAMYERYSVIMKITWLSFLLIPCILLASRTKQLMNVLRATNRPFLAVMLLSTLSIAWSIDTAATLARLEHVFAIIFICLAVVCVGWNMSRVQQVTRPILTVLLLGSLIFGLVAPDLAITPPVPPDTHYYWHGLTTQKNQLGSLASLGALFWLHGWASREVRLAPAFGGWAIAMACLVLSRSATSLMATILASVLLLLITRSTPAMRRYTPYVVGIFATVTLAYSMAVLKVIPGLDVLLQPIMALSGKDATFSGRTQIWEIMRDHIHLAPILGSGYGAYWAGPVPTSPSYVFLRLMYFYPSEAHNGYLDTINDLGYVGLALLLAYIVFYIVQSLRVWRISRAAGSLFLALIFQQLLANLSETHWLYVGNDFIVLTLCTFAIARASLEPAAAAQAAAPSKAAAVPTAGRRTPGGVRRPPKTRGRLA